MGPRPQELGIANARSGIEQALHGLALWCPHGMDSSRVGDYHRAEEARELLEKARLILGREW